MNYERSDSAIMAHAYTPALSDASAAIRRKDLELIWRDAATEALLPALAVSGQASTPRLSADAARALRFVLVAVDEEPVEDGLAHPAESLLESHLETYGADGLTHQLLHSRRGADLLKLLGRTSRLALRDQARLVRIGLGSPHVEVRDAAIQAVENWGEGGLHGLLQSHHEPVEWLARYARDVLSGLRG